MDDLLVSIRKIVADDEADRPRPAVRAALSLNRDRRALRPAANADQNLTALVEQSMLDAFGVVDSEAGEGAGLRRGRRDPFADESEAAEIKVAVHSIAKAIAAERQERSRGSVQGRELDRHTDLDDEGWSGNVGRKPDLDAAPQPLARGAPGAPLAIAGTSRVAAARPAGLRGRLEAPSRGERLTRSDPEPAEPLAPNVRRLEPEPRTPEVTDAAVDVKPQGGDGAVFRRQTGARADRDDGLTSARTQQSVSSQLDQLSRTVLANNSRTLEDLVRDLVRPLLREWLEANLHDIVERQVRQEIDRISARAR